MQQVLCPQCGAPVKFTSTASVMAVCGACRSTLLKDAESVRRIGETPSAYRRRMRPMVVVPGTIPQILVPGCLTLMGQLPTYQVLEAAE